MRGFFRKSDGSLKLGNPSRRRSAGVLLVLLVAAAIIAAYLMLFNQHSSAGRLLRLRLYWSDPDAHPEWIMDEGVRCGEAPFVFPTEGMVGFLWGDSFRPGHLHQGIDVFGPTGPNGLGETPVVAAYDGYLTRLPDWRSSLIIRIPEDPLRPSRQIWTYYTHLADAEGNSFILHDFPPGTYERYVRAGTLLGYQGNFSADPDNPTGMHLHFSIVLDDGAGGFKNELKIKNTLDPSPYLGFNLNASEASDNVAVCRP
jgi:murein DD-endopeptidase MepM/ murein hydrolase activator NlpD